MAKKPPMTKKEFERSGADKKADKAALAKINAKRGDGKKK
jgi:hypothetical protein